MKTLLVPIDFSAQTRLVVSEAVALALPGRARIVLVHVLQSPDVIADYGTAGSYLIPVLETMGRDAARQLASWKKRIESKGLAVSTEQLSGAARPKLIADLARRIGADYIVMGSHGHTAFYDVIAGSTTSSVLKLAPCPVVIVPPGRKAPAR